MNGLILTEVDLNDDGVIDETNDGIYVPICDDRGSLVGVSDGTGSPNNIIEKIYYNSTGIMRVFDGAGSEKLNATTGGNTGKSEFISFGWAGMYHEEFGLYHTHYREYDALHRRWLSEDPAGYVDGMNLYFMYSSVNSVDLLGLDDLYAFDGTSNHANVWNPKFHGTDPGGRNYKTNVARMVEVYKGNNKTYIPGVGSGFHPSGKAYNNGDLNVFSWSYYKIKSKAFESGMGAAMTVRAKYAFDVLKKRIKDGKEGATIIDVAGFSRGSAIALEFLNLIAADKELSKIVKVRTTSLFDTVAGVGWTGKADYSNWGKSLELPKLNYLSSPIHALALDEQRAEFKIVKFKGAINIGFRGVHSNIGSSYDPHSYYLSSIPLRFMIDMANVNSKSTIYDTDQLYFGKHSYSYMKGHFDHFSKTGEGSYNYMISDNTGDLLINDYEKREFPKGMILHPSVKKLNHLPPSKNLINGAFKIEK